MSTISFKHAMISLLVIIAVDSLFIGENIQAAQPAPSFVEGRDFITKFPFEKPKEPVLVEFFSFMCPACFKYESTVQRWLKQKPDSVKFIRIPVSFGRTAWQLVAKGYYIAEELKVTAKFSQEMFKKVHIDRKPPRKLADIGKIFVAMGISQEDFDKVSTSFAVDSKVRKAGYLVKKYKVPSVPYFLMNYKYESTKEATQSQESLFRNWNLLPLRDF